MIYGLDFLYLTICSIVNCKTKRNDKYYHLNTEIKKSTTNKSIKILNF
ncbi:hypothetical protein CNEO4_330001 [Clostridium neonatale]|nr:hypothetical protein CNEO4_330001 [Clostridium neonatale]